MSTQFEGIPENAQRNDGVFIASSQDESPFAGCEFELGDNGELKVWRLSQEDTIKMDVTDDYLKWVETAPKVFYAKFEWIVDPKDL